MKPRWPRQQGKAFPSRGPTDPPAKKNCANGPARNQGSDASSKRRCSFRRVNTSNSNSPLCDSAFAPMVKWARAFVTNACSGCLRARRANSGARVPTPSVRLGLSQRWRKSKPRLRSSPDHLPTPSSPQRQFLALRNGRGFLLIPEAYGKKIPFARRRRSRRDAGDPRPSNARTLPRSWREPARTPTSQTPHRRRQDRASGAKMP